MLRILSHKLTQCPSVPYRAVPHYAVPQYPQYVAAQYAAKDPFGGYCG